MRGLVLLVVCAACGPPPGTPSSLPAPPPHALDDVAPRLVAGEQTTWNVFYQAMPIGSADLVIGERGARTTFRTSRIARALASVRYELATALDRGRVRGARDDLTVDGDAERAETAIDGASYTAGGQTLRVPGDTHLHTLHSALGAVRAWSVTRGAGPGYLWLWSGGRLYRLDLRGRSATTCSASARCGSTAPCARRTSRPRSPSRCGWRRTATARRCGSHSSPARTA